MDTRKQLIRRWLSLLIDRWHVSSRVVLVAALLLLVLCNVAGQLVHQIHYETAFPFFVVEQFEHGWPLTYLVRDGRQTDAFYSKFPPPPPRTVRDCFALWSFPEEFRLGAFLADVCVAGLLAVAAGVAFEAWRRQRSSLWHIHLRDCFATMLAICLLAAWLVEKQRRHAVEEAAFADSPGQHPDMFSDLSLQISQTELPSWLRLCLGHEPLRLFERPFEVAVWNHPGWSKLEHVRSMRHVYAEDRGSTEDLAQLAKLPHLEALSLDDDWTPSVRLPTRSGTAELPPLPALRGLFIAQPLNHCRRIDRLTSLESLRICYGVDEQALREIGTLKNLRDLALDDLPESDDLSSLPSLPRLEALNLYSGHIDAAKLQSIGQCRQLKNLDFYMCHVDGSALRHLAGLPRLEILNLSNTNIADEDLLGLTNLQQLREVNLDSTKLKGTTLASLAGLPKLETLSLRNVYLDKEGKEQARRLKQLKRFTVLANDS